MSQGNSITMAQDEHRLFTTPVSVNDGLKRADGRTWAVLGASAVVAGLIVLVIALFVPKPDVKWPDSQHAPKATVPDEPRTYDVAPPPGRPTPR